MSETERQRFIRNLRVLYGTPGWTPSADATYEEMVAELERELAADNARDAAYEAAERRVQFQMQLPHETLTSGTGVFVICPVSGQNLEWLPF